MVPRLLFLGNHLRQVTLGIPLVENLRWTLPVQQIIESQRSRQTFSGFRHSRLVHGDNVLRVQEQYAIRVAELIGPGLCGLMALARTEGPRGTLERHCAGRRCGTTKPELKWRSRNHASPLSGLGKDVPLFAPPMSNHKGIPKQQSLS